MLSNRCSKEREKRTFSLVPHLNVENYLCHCAVMCVMHRDELKKKILKLNKTLNLEAINREFFSISSELFNSWLLYGVTANCIVNGLINLF